MNECMPDSSAMNQLPPPQLGLDCGILWDHQPGEPETICSETRQSCTSRIPKEGSCSESTQPPPPPPPPLPHCSAPLFTLASSRAAASPRHRWPSSTLSSSCEHSHSQSHSQEQQQQHHDHHSLPSFSSPASATVSPRCRCRHSRRLSASAKHRPTSFASSSSSALASRLLPLPPHLILVILVLFVPTFAHALNPLNEYIRHYEPLSYDHQATSTLHRSRRAADLYSKPEHHHEDDDNSPTYVIDFNAHGRAFPLRLKRDTHSSVFHPDLVIEDGDGRPLSVSLDHLVSGHLANQPNSVVFGSVRSGVFEGRIHSTVPKPTVFYVERAHRYFAEAEPTAIYLLGSPERVNRTHSTNYNLYDLVSSVQRAATSSPAPQTLPLPFHSVIYSSNNVVDAHRPKRNPLDGACGADAKVRAWMDQVAHSAVAEERPAKEAEAAQSEASSSSSRAKSSSSGGHSPSSSPRFFHSEAEHNRSRRAANYYHNYRIPNYEAAGRISYRPTPPPQAPSPYLPTKRACSLYIQTDTFLWDHVKKHESEKSDAKVREEIASLVAQHIKAVNHIYETSVFKDIIGLKFIVQRLRINDSSACEGVKRENNQFCSPNIDVSNFLNLNSQFNHNDFCLAYIFTYRDFSGGTLGLAWVASTSGASGGICEKYKTYTENIGGRQVQTKRSLNTGIITFVNYNSRVPPKVSELTLAHEIGHNFGSPHDYPAECRPGGALGNFIMYSSATSGERQNNNKFSHCSIANISSVLAAVFNNEGKENCFQEDNGPFCGNKIVEEGEECDCGYDSRECNEDCCYPRNVEEFKAMDPYAQPCRRRPGAYCSPSEGPCCTEKCTFEGDTKQCRDDGECTYKSLCDGQRAHCPSPPAKPNKTECNMGTQVCWKGSCTGSICQKYDLEECFLTAKRGAKADEMCEVACQRRNQPDTCRRTSEIVIMKNISGLKLRPGSPCNDFQGYCDVFQRCRPVDAEGPLARLKNLLFNKKTLISIKQWVTTYWWACTLIMFGAILFMAAFIKCCAVHTPSSNPKRKKALRITDTLRRPADTLRRKSRERSAASSAANGHHRVNGNRDGHGNGHRSGGGGGGGGHRGDRERGGHSSGQHMPLTSMHPPSSSSGQSGSAAPASSSGGGNHSNAHHGHSSSAYPQPSSSSGGHGHSSQAPLAAAVAASSSVGQLPPTLVVNLPPPSSAKDLAHFDPPPPYPGIPKPSAPPLTLIAPPASALSNGGPPSHGWRHNRQGGPSSSQAPTSAKSTSSSSSASSSKPANGKKGDHHHHHEVKGRRS